MPHKPVPATVWELRGLQKQGWKLIMQPDCLFARVMKAKYFLNGDFMSAGLGAYPSYTWRSILGARYLLEEGMGW